MKILTIYVAGSVFKYPGMFQDYCCELDPNTSVLKILKLSRGAQYKEEECSVFRNWDYYMIEEENEV